MPTFGGRLDRCNRADARACGLACVENVMRTSCIPKGHCAVNTIDIPPPHPPPPAILRDYRNGLRRPSICCPGSAGSAAAAICLATGASFLAAVDGTIAGYFFPTCGRIKPRRRAPEVVTLTALRHVAGTSNGRAKSER